MTSIIRGTTPTLKYVFNTVNVSDITVAYLTIKIDNDPTHNIEKTLSDAEVGQDYILWSLTQAETLTFKNDISVMINWKLADGTRGASKKTIFIIDSNYKEIEI